jgi:hypothetical protein
MDNPNVLIKAASHYAVNEINDGKTPTEALKKAAEYYDLNYDYIQRVGEQLNVALHYNHYKTASDRTEEFLTADIPKVQNALYEDQEKTANHFISEQFSSSELFNPIPDLDKIFTNPKQKEAYMKIASAPRDQKVPLSPKAIFEKSTNYILELEKQATNALIKKEEAKNNMEASFLNLASGFKKDAAYRTSFAEFESQVYSKYGKDSLPLLDMLYKQANLKETRGIYDDGYIMFHECPELKAYQKFIKYSEEMLSTEKEATEAKENVIFEKEYIDDIYKVSEDLKKNPIENGEQDQKIAGILDSVFEHIKEQLKGEQKKNPGTQSDSIMDNFERQTVLQDLLLRDPILKKEDHNKVIQAYEQIVKLSPDLAMQKEVVRALLRQMVAGQALAPHSSNQLVEANLNMLKLKNLQSGNFSSVR